MSTAATARPGTRPARARPSPGLLVLALLTLALLWVALYWALGVAPTERTMGEIQRIFYYHVPAAAASWAAFGVNCVASLIYLWKPSDRADAWALAGAEVGMAFLTIVLITGPIWGRPVWGVWWVWDPRLTLTFAMWVMYASYLIMRQLTAPGGRQPRIAAGLAIFFAVDIPIDYMSIRWWPGQHPSPVLFGGPDSGLDPRMAVALCLGFAAFLALAGLLAWMRANQEMTHRQVCRLREQWMLSEEN